LLCIESDLSETVLPVRLAAPKYVMITARRTQLIHGDSRRGQGHLHRVTPNVERVIHFFLLLYRATPRGMLDGIETIGTLADQRTLAESAGSSGMPRRRVAGQIRKETLMKSKNDDHLENIVADIVTLASKLINEYFDAGRICFAQQQEDTSLVMFLIEQLFMDCHASSQSSLLLTEAGTEWDADIINRSVMEGTMKYAFLMHGDPGDIA
jgi:hypothetical protein